MTRKLLTIIIPVRSEEETIGGTIELVEKTVHTPHIIMIADDTIDPSDKTIDIVEAMKNNSRCHAGLASPDEAWRSRDPASLRFRLGGRNDRFVICKKTKGDMDGFGPALVRASKKVRTPYTVFVMADGSDEPATIDRMISTIQRKTADVVVGCRYIKGGKKVGGPALQGILSTWFNAFFYYGLRFPTRDSTNAFKLYRTEFLQRILPAKPESGVEFSLQLTIRAVFNNAYMIDVPTTWRGRKKGHSKVRLLKRGPVYVKLAMEALNKKWMIPI